MFMHTFLLRVEVLPSGAFVAGTIWARHEPILAVLIHMGLNMTPRYDFLTSLRYERTSHPNLVAHVNEDAGRSRRHAACGRSAGGAREVVQVFQVGRADGIPQTFLAENMIAW